MRISYYELLQSSTGDGYIDSPYVVRDLYIRGDAAISWTVDGAGKFAINLSDIMQQVFAEETSYHVISVYVNGVLARVDNSVLTETKDFGLTMDLTGDSSEIELVFNSNLSKTDNLTYIKTLSSFLLIEKPESTATPPADEAPDTGQNTDPDELITSNGLRVATVDFSSVCGPYTAKISPDTGEFHFINNEVWFTGSRRVERGYIVTVSAYDANGTEIESKSLEFSIARCNSSADCVLDENGDPSRGDGSGNSGDDADLDEDIAVPTDLTASSEECGTNDGVLMVITDIVWSSPSDSNTFDVQVSRGNAFNLVSDSYMGMIGNQASFLLLADTTYFARTRTRSEESTNYSRWSDTLSFVTSPDGSCEGPISPPEPPEISPIICPTGIPPGGPEEPPVDPNPNDPTDPDPNDPTDDPTGPTPPRGPNDCFGSGCGDTPPPRRPNTPGNFPPDNPGPGGCIGPGCTGGTPGDPENPGDPGGPGGPQDPNPPEEVPPNYPPPRVPTCNDDKLHSSVFTIKNAGNETIYVVLEYSDTNGDCGDYLVAIGEEDGTPINGTTDGGTPVAAGQTLSIDLGATCPECVYPCVTSPNPQPYEWYVATVAYDDDGNPESPYQHKATRQLTTPSCSCDGVPLLSILENQSYNQDGILENITYGAANLNGPLIALNRLPSAGNELCIQVRQTRYNTNTGKEQERQKTSCYSCDGKEWIETTTDLIGCETALWKRFKEPGVSNRLVSFPNHWEMSNWTFQFAKGVWPDTTFEPWELSTTPFQSSGWDLESDLCVTCCTEGEPDPDTGWKERIIGGMIGGDTGASNSLAVLPFNNISCTDGIQDPNLGGSTGFVGNGSAENRSYISPCGPFFQTLGMVDDNQTSALAGQHFEQYSNGFNPPSAGDILDIGGASCGPNDPEVNAIACTKFAIGSDYSYTRGYSLQILGCNEVAGRVGTPYKLQYVSPNVGVKVTWSTNIDCTAQSPANGEIQFSGRFGTGELGLTEIPYGINFSGNNTGFWQKSEIENNWSETTIFADGTLADPQRYNAKQTLAPYQNGPSSQANPLP